MNKTDIKSLDYKALQAEIERIGEKKFRAKQMYEWMHVKLVRSFDEMTNLSLALREKIIMPKGFRDAFSQNENYEDSFRQCLEKGKAYIDYDRKVAEFAKDTGPIRRGIGVAAFWYNTGVYPISLETSSNRMLLNLDGTVTMQCGETEIGQGADTAYAQMTADVVGLNEIQCGNPGLYSIDSTNAAMAEYMRTLFTPDEAEQQGIGDVYKRWW